MRFEILSDCLERPGEETPYGTIPLRSKAAGRDFFLDSGARRLLETEPGEHDFEEAFGGEDGETRQRLRDGLRLMAAFGAARILPEPETDGFCFRVAGERDYKAASALINGSRTRRFGLIPRDERAMSEDNLRARQFNNLEYLFLCLRGGALAAVMITAMPKAESLSAAFRICGIALSDTLSEADGREVIRGLCGHVVSAFEGEFAVCRYLSMAEEDLFIPFLREFGFSRTARLEKETVSGGDVTIYDLRIRQREVSC